MHRFFVKQSKQGKGGARCHGMTVSALLLAPVLLVQTLPAQAAGSTSKLEEMVVYGRGEALIGVAAAASEGAVAQEDLAVRPLLRVAELLEAVPGMIAVQHSGSGKANQYFLRGFNLDHGTDFTTYVDDVPMNLRSHGHGQGYLDLNGLIPEMVQRIDYRKGPYRADLGDFALAGAALISSVDTVAPFVSLEAGEYGWRRVAAGGTQTVGDGALTLIGEGKTYDGPWQQPEDLNHQSLHGKYSLQTGWGELSASLWGYHAAWNPTEQIPERVIGSSVCADRFCALDDSATGETDRAIATVRAIGADWRATLYAQYYDWQMYSNSTYDYQIKQFDSRQVYGGRYEQSVIDNRAVQLSVGVEGRVDDISDVGLQHTERRGFIETLGRHSIDERSLGLYSELTWRPIDPLRLMAGLRGDRYDFDVSARDGDFAEGSTHDQLLSPKLGVAYALNANWEFYGNAGRGFHSNDARGAVDANTPVPGLVRGDGEELGVRFQHGSLSLTATYWWLELDSELKFVGDSNSVEPSSGSRRHGYELVSFWRPLPWLAIDATWTESHARFEESADAPYIPGAIESAGELGVAVTQGMWELGARVRHLGPYPLIEDDSERANSETVVNLRAAWSPGPLSIYGELLNVFDHKGEEIVYFYESNVAGFDPPGVPVEGRVSRTIEPRTVRVGVKYSWE